MVGLGWSPRIPERRRRKDGSYIKLAWIMILWFYFILLFFNLQVGPSPSRIPTEALMCFYSISLFGDDDSSLWDAYTMLNGSVTLKTKRIIKLYLFRVMLRAYAFSHVPKDWYERVRKLMVASRNSQDSSTTSSWWRSIQCFCGVFSVTPHWTRGSCNNKDETKSHLHVHRHDERPSCKTLIYGWKIKYFHWKITSPRGLTWRLKWMQNYTTSLSKFLTFHYPNLGELRSLPSNVIAPCTRITREKLKIIISNLTRG